MKTMALQVSGNLLMTVHGPDPMTDPEKQECLDALKGVDLDTVRALVYTKGGGPTAAQRKALQDAYGGRTVPTAILCEGPLVRGMVTAMSWFNPSIRAFPTTEIDSALKYLEVPQDRWDHIRREVMRLLREVESASGKPASGG
jgi:hypothetical protein